MIYSLQVRSTSVQHSLPTNFIPGVLISISGLFGLPWICAAPVRSIAHVASLSRYSKTHAPGEKPRLIDIKDQRLTNIGVHILIGCTIFAGPIIRKIPVAALFGIFLYFGIVSIPGTQLFSRVKMIFIPAKYHPNVGYLRRVCIRIVFWKTPISSVTLGPTNETFYLYNYSNDRCWIINLNQDHQLCFSLPIYTCFTCSISQMVSSVCIHRTRTQRSKALHSHHSNPHRSFSLSARWRRRRRKYFRRRN